MALSPMMTQYLKIKEQYSDTILLYRLGDFYEMFFEDAKTGSRELELTLTGRDCGLEERAPMCGVPHHAVDSYIARLIQKGYKVAVCEQVTPADGQKGIIDRQVVRVITAGTVTENIMLCEDKNNYLAAIYYEDGMVGVSWADITTGEFNHAFFEPPVAARLNDLLSRISPSEIICNNDMLAVSLELSIVKFGGVCPFSTFDDTAFDAENAERLLKASLSQEAFLLLKKQKLCLNSAGALMEYLNTTQKKALKHIKNISIDRADDYLLIDSTASKTLELIENMQDSGKKGTLLWLLDKTSTNMGKRLLRKWIAQPSRNHKTINDRLNAVEELLGSTMSDKLLDLLDKVYDIERLAGKLSCMTISPRELLSLRDSLDVLPQIKNILADYSSDLLNDIANRIEKFEGAVNLISSAIADEPSANIKEGGVIKKGFDEKLDEYLLLTHDIGKVLAELEGSEKEETGIKNLKIGYNRVFGYYIEVPKSQLSAVPYRYVRKQTVASGERYITEELKKLETKILQAQEQSLLREQELYLLILKKLSEFIDSILATSKAIAEIDCLISFSNCAKEYNYTKPILNTEIKHIKILEGRHCIVERLLKNENFVPNDTILDSTENRIMVITGPNMAGKSIYMKQVALIVIMAHIGCFVPAKYAEISLTDKIFTRVGASDDLATGRSTFMVEMTEVADIIKNLTPNSLVLLDEIGRGTSTYDGLSIAWSIIEYLSKKSTAKTLFSTHYHELTELEGVLDGVKNYKLTIKEIENTIIFLRRLMRGSANRSFGIEVASLAGLSDDIVKRAKEILKLLENADIGRQHNMSGANQLSFFNNSAANEIMAILKDLDTENISARHALDILYDLKEKVENDVKN